MPTTRKSNRFRPTAENLEVRDVPTATPYLVPTSPLVSTTAIITTGDSVGSYTMAGTPDGLGVFDNGDGTVTVLMNHEFVLGDQSGTAHAHNASLLTDGNAATTPSGSFVDRLVVRKSDLAVLSGGDLIRSVLDAGTGNPVTGNALNFQRLCSADLAAASAFFDAASGNGTAERILLNGEEVNGGRVLATVVTGPNAGTTYLLPAFNAFGGGSWENLLANPGSGDTTLVMGDSDGGTGANLNKVMAYVGTKQATGNEVERAGLTNGTLYQIAVTGVTAESRNSALGTSSLVTTGTFTLSTGGGTTFLRPEDGAWDPNHPNDFYFVTTDQLDTVRDGVGTQVGRSRLWKLHFTDLSNPTAGGTIEAVLDGTEGQNMLDNITIDTQGRVLMNEDVGNAAHNGKVWMYDIATDSLHMVAQHDPARFGGIGVPATAPFTQDEESSGILDVSAIFGPGTYLVDVQAHYPNGAALVEGGQLLLMQIATPTVESVTVNDGSAQRSRVTSLTVTFSTQVTFAEGTFTLTAADGSTVDLSVSSSVVGGKTVAVLTFNGESGTFGSLADGTYTLTIDGDKVTDSLGQKVDADGDGSVGGRRTETFTALFGDLDGDGVVTGADVSAAAHSIGAKTGDANYFWFLDYNGDGTIDGRDEREVAHRNLG